MPAPIRNAGMTFTSEYKLKHPVSFVQMLLHIVLHTFFKRKEFFRISGLLEFGHLRLSEILVLVFQSFRHLLIEDIRLHT